MSKRMGTPSPTIGPTITANDVALVEELGGGTT